MTKSTLLMILLAGLTLGVLIGVSRVDDDVVGGAADAPGVVLDTGGLPVFRYLVPGNLRLEYDQFGVPLPGTSGENFIARARQPKTDSLTLRLESGEEAEYKALMSQGDTLVFHWATDGGVAYYDLHAHDGSFGPDFYTRYDAGEGTERSGSIVAPYAGQHGWYWINTEPGPMTITLEVAGFYDELIEIELDNG